MSNDINELDANDDGLKAIFGSRFEDGKLPGKPIKHRPKETYVDIPDAECEEVPRDLRKVSVEIGDKLVAFSKKALVYAALSWLCLYWQSVGLMDASIAVPSMWVCAAMAGWGAGRLALNRK